MFGLEYQYFSVQYIDITMLNLHIMFDCMTFFEYLRYFSVQNATSKSIQAMPGGWMPPSATVLRNSDAAGAVAALDEMWKRQAEAIVMKNVGAGNWKLVKQKYKIGQAELNVFHLSAVVAALAKDENGEVATK